MYIYAIIYTVFAGKIPHLQFFERWLNLMKLKEKKQKPKQDEKQLARKKYEEYRLRPKRILKVLFIVLSLLGCLVASAVYTYFSIGDGIGAYDAQLYTSLETTFTENIRVNDGLDALTIRKSVKSFELVDNDNGAYIKAVLQNGYFIAELTATLDENYEIIRFTRNFENLQTYIEHYALDFGIRTLIIGVVLWIIIMLMWHLIVYLFAVGMGVTDRQIAREQAKKEEAEATPSEENIVLTPVAAITEN